MIEEVFVDDVQLHDVTAGVAAGDFAVTALNGLGTPTPRGNRPPKARRHGTYELTSYYDGRALELRGRIKGSDFDAFWTNVDLIKKMFGLTGVRRSLKWKRSGEAFLMTSEISPANELEIAIPSGRIQPITSYSVDLIAADPRIYKDEWEDFTFASTATVTNDGNFSTPPIITFNTPGTNPGLRNDALTTENEINFNYGGGGTALVVDMQERTVTLDGTSRPDLVDLDDSSFWSLVSGSNHLTKIGGATSITIEWRAAWN